MATTPTRIVPRFTAEYVEKYLERRTTEVGSLELGGDTLCNLSIIPHEKYSGPIMNDIFTCPLEIANALAEFILKYPNIKVRFYSNQRYAIEVKRFKLVISSDRETVAAYMKVADIVGSGSDNVAGWLFQGIERSVYAANGIPRPRDFSDTVDYSMNLRYVLSYLELLGILPLHRD